MSRAVHSIPFATGLQRVAEGASAYLQPDGHYGLNNVAVFWTDDGAVMVDAAYDIPRTRRIVGAIQAEARDGRIAALVLTHEHGDHTFGASEVPTGEVIMTATAAQSQQRAPAALAARIGGLGEESRAMMETLLQDKFDFSGIRLRKPTRTFSGRMTLHAGAAELELVEFGNIHTASDCAVIDRASGVAAAGDMMFADSHVPLFAPNAARWAKALEDLLATGCTRFVPGHGRICDEDDVRQHRDYLLWLLELAHRSHAAGLTPDEAADRAVQSLGEWSALERPDVLVNSLAVAYREVAPDYPVQSYADSLAQRWRFRSRWAGRVAGMNPPLPLHTRLGGMRTLSELRLAVQD